AQEMLCGDVDAAREIAAAAKVLDIAAGEVLIRQDAADNDVYFVLSGRFRIHVNGRDVAVRTAREHVGEMAAVDLSARRSASVVAATESVVAKLDESAFSRIADKYPRLWRVIARTLCRRLDQRKRFHVTPNEKPIMFVGSSSETQAVAQA